MADRFESGIKKLYFIIPIYFLYLFCAYRDPQKINLLVKETKRKRSIF